MKWFRFYHEVLDDPKVQDLEPALFKHWVNLLCLANAQEPRGTIPDNPHFIAFRLHIRDATAAKVVAELTARGLLEMAANCRLSLHNWEKRQAKSDDSAPRVAALRAASPETNRVNVTAKPPLLKRDNSSLDREREGERDSSPPEKRGDDSGATAPAPLTPRGNPKVSAVVDALRSEGMTGRVTPRDAKAIRETEHDPVVVAALYAAIFRGEYGDAWMHDNLSVALCLEKLPGWLSFRAGHRAPPKPNGTPPGGQAYLLRELALAQSQHEAHEEGGAHRGPDEPKRLPGRPVQAGHHAQ